MKKLYETAMISEGGRNGKVSSPDGSLELEISTPGGGKNGTNPEQLFAAGYSACFNSALELVLLQSKKKVKSIVKGIVSLVENDNKGIEIAVVLEGKIEGFSAEETLKWMKKAHELCPYSKATKGNIDVELKAK